MKRNVLKTTAVITALAAALSAVPFSALGYEYYDSTDGSAELRPEYDVPLGGYDNDYDYYPDDDHLFAPNISVSGNGQTVYTHENGELSFKIRNNSDFTVEITDPSLYEAIQKKTSRGWVNISDDSYDNYADFIKIRGRRSYSAEIDVSGLDSGDYRIVFFAGVHGESMSPNYIEFTVESSVSITLESGDVLFTDETAQLYINNPTENDIVFYPCEAVLEKLSGGKYTESEMTDYEDYPDEILVLSDDSEFIDLELFEMFKNMTDGEYRLTIPWYSTEYDDYTEEGTAEICFKVKSPVSVKLMPTTVKGKDNLKLKLKLTNNTDEKIVIEDIGKLQRRQSSKWRYLSYRKNSPGINNSYTIRPGKTVTVSIPLCSYYYEGHLRAGSYRVPVNYGDKTEYLKFSLSVGKYVSIK
ncbi:MAG: hypothetical protein IJ446_06180 [Oscillospiraceae bacterium]|nr:hypothetical protein [Oscillospiraceae bacterium]